MPQLAAHDGPIYMRLLRGNVPIVLDEYDYTFELGKAEVLRDGRDVAVHLHRADDHARAGRRAERSEADSVDVAVLHVPTIKPLDTTAILREARHRPAGRSRGKPHHHRRPRRSRRVRCCSAPASRPTGSARSRCPTSSSTPAPCPPCTGKYGLYTDSIVAKVLDGLA